MSDFEIMNYIMSNTKKKTSSKLRIEEIQRRFTEDSGKEIEVKRVKEVLEKNDIRIHFGCEIYGREWKMDKIERAVNKLKKKCLNK